MPALWITASNGPSLLACSATRFAAAMLARSPVTTSASASALRVSLARASLRACSTTSRPCPPSTPPAITPRPVDEPVMKTRAMSAQALPVSTLICTLLYRRAPSTPIVSEARGGASFFFPLACARERSAGRRFGNKLTPRERRRVPYARHARLPALHCGDFLHGLRTSWPGPERLPLTLSGRHWRRRSSRPVQPSKADPSSGSGSDRASRSVVTSHGCGRRTLLRQIDVSR